MVVCREAQLKIEKVHFIVDGNGASMPFCRRELLHALNCFDREPGSEALSFKKKQE